MRTLAIAAALAFAAPADAAVIVLANYTPADVTYTVTEPGGKPRTLTLPAYQVAPVTVAGPADLVAPAGGKAAPVRVDPYQAYVFVPDPAGGVAVQGLELPGKAPAADAKPEPNPAPRTPVKVPVTLLVDDADPRAEKGWQPDVRKRFDAAAAILEAQTGFRLELAGFATWKSDPAGKSADGQLATFEKAVAVKPGTLAVGFTSRPLDEGGEAPFGACRGIGSGHVLVRTWRPKTEREQTEVLFRYLAVALGAVGSPDAGSVMRPRLGDGQANIARFVIRLDPLNALALNLWADARRGGVTDWARLAPADRVRLFRVYAALAVAAPDDALAADYYKRLRDDDVKPPDPAVRPDPSEPADRLRRAEAVRAVVRAVTARAKANAGPDGLAGDELTAALVSAAAGAALAADEADRAAAFLLGLGVALDDGSRLRDDPATAAAVKEVETDAERADRLAVLGNPTLRNRRDLCRHFAVGCAAGDLLTPAAAEAAAVADAVASARRASGVGFPNLAAEFAGVAFARKLRTDPAGLLRRVRDRFSAADLVPAPAGLRDGMGAEKFEAEFGGPADTRFRVVVEDIRRRVNALPVYRGRVD
ncbi:MAG: hypothetical protein C0501_30905 [Isosphaera sp.]|nr:hypothetical protein [Isosphaera sp.]